MPSDLDVRMKLYESASDIRLMPNLPVMARIDGKNFHSVCKTMDRPYDKDFSDLMVKVMTALAVNTVATCAYCQSDEITLCWTNHVYFEGRLSKLTSVLASMATYYFVDYRPENLLIKSAFSPIHFDCRVWAVPNTSEAANVFVWREADATRNSIQMAGQDQFSHKELNKKSCDDIQEMLWQKGINWNNYPEAFKRGTYCRRILVKRPFTKDELLDLPFHHDAHRNPGMLVERHEYDTRPLNLPIVKISNRNEVLFQGRTENYV